MGERSTASDLPELDSVSAGGRGSYVVNVIAWLFASLLAGGVCGGVYALVRLGSRSGIDWIAFAAIVAVGAVVAAFLMTKTNWFDCNWTTDSSGLAVSGPFRERLIAWSEVMEATGKTALGDKMTVTLKTSLGKIVLSDAFDATGGTIGASIYQHLRRYGKSDESLLSPGARTFWTPIPREVPNEMDWHNPKPPDWPLTLVIALLVVVVVVLAYFVGPRLDWGHAWSFLHQFAGALIPLGYHKFRERLIAARSVSVRHDGIEMRTARGMVYVPWTDIGCVSWHQQQNTLTIGRSTYSDVAMIRYRADDPTSATLILAIIRQLRAVHHQPPVVIPKPLLPMLGLAGVWQTGGAASGEPVEVRPLKGRPLVVVVVVLLGAAIVFALAWSRHLFPFVPRVLSAFAILNLLTGLLLLRQSTLVYRADAEGITVKSLGQSRLIRWQDVASYITKQSALVSAQNRVLKDLSGRTLLTLALPEGSRSDIDLFLACVDAKLAPVRQDNTRVLMR